MKPIFALSLPLFLAACADCPPLSRADVLACQRQAEAGLTRLEDCICDRPTASLPDTLRERGDRMPDADRSVTPEPPKPEPEPEGPKHPGKEPPREAGEAAHDVWKEAGGKWP